MTAALIDTNILIDHFQGLAQADTELAYYDDLAISAITWMELMTAFKAKRVAGVMTRNDYTACTAFVIPSRLFLSTQAS